MVHDYFDGNAIFQHHAQQFVMPFREFLERLQVSLALVARLTGINHLK